VGTFARLDAWRDLVMSQRAEKSVYRFAYDEAASELQHILSSFDRLQAQKQKIENLIEVLKPEVGDVAPCHARPNGQRKTHLPNCIVITRLTVL
jgi:hypothetical protein